MNGQKTHSESVSDATPLPCAQSDAALADIAEAEESDSAAEATATKKARSAIASSGQTARASAASVPAMGFFLSGLSVLLVVSLAGVVSYQRGASEARHRAGSPAALSPGQSAAPTTATTAFGSRTIETVRAYSDDNNAQTPAAATPPADIRELAAATRGADSRRYRTSLRFRIPYQPEDDATIEGVNANALPAADLPRIAPKRNYSGNAHASLDADDWERAEY